MNLFIDIQISNDGITDFASRFSPKKNAISRCVKNRREDEDIPLPPFESERAVIRHIECTDFCTVAAFRGVPIDRIVQTWRTKEPTEEIELSDE